MGTVDHVADEVVGAGRIERLPQTPIAIRLVRQFTHFFAALLWVAALLALIADWWMPGQGMATLAAAIVAVIAINGSTASESIDLLVRFAAAVRGRVVSIAGVTLLRSANTSRACWYRCSTCLSSAFMTMRSSSGGTRGFSRAIGSGWLCTMRYSVSATDPPANGNRPVSSSYITTPEEKMSERTSTVRPTACSGL